MADSRPNILFIMTDQQSATAMSCAGNDALRTPAMDSLASRGVRFARTYCTFPLCTPSRFSLMSGRYPHDIGCAGNAITVPPEIVTQTLGHLLRNNGYTCAYGGKWHVGPSAVPEGFGFERICGFDDNALPAAATAFLDNHRDGPFCLVASFDNPHNICEWARNQRLPHGEISDAPTDQCPNLPANFAIPPLGPQALDDERAFNHFVHPTSGATPDWWRHYRHAYFRLVEKVDAQIGLILDALRRRGFADNTLVVFTSDHGDGHGAHQWNQKSALYEESIGVPLIVCPPGGGGAPRVDQHLISNGLDLVPTLCDYAGAAMPTGLHGRSLRQLIERGDDEAWRRDLLVQTAFPGPNYRGTAGRALVGERYKYSVYSWGRYREQLIDLEADPGELVNLAAESRHGERLNDCRRRMQACRAALSDATPTLL